MESLKLCVSCKGCKRECPTGVDMAKMKIEVLAARARTEGLSLHDRLVAYLPRYAPSVARMPWLANMRDRLPGLPALSEAVAGFAASRPLPRWASRPYTDSGHSEINARSVVLMVDTFNRYFEPDNLRAAQNVLEAGGYRVHTPAPEDAGRPLCCGRTFLASGLVDEARVEARRTLNTLLPYIKRGVPILGLEPSCLLTLRDEFEAMLPGSDAAELARSAQLFEEFLARQMQEGELVLNLQAPAKRALLHGHCHQKAFDVMSTVEQALRLIPEMEVEHVSASCCGMAGAFGYRKDTAEISRQMAELDLLPAVRKADPDTLIVADGTSCRHQIADLSERTALHVARVLEMALVPI